jgi:hypothetical protein
VAKTKEQIKSKDMRKILFKAKCLSDGKWYQGFYYETPNGISYIRNDKYTVQVDPATVCQFTGLCDKNGLKIFEYDKVKYGSIKSVVKWDSRAAKFSYVHEIYTDKIEVIGNIHDK